MICSPTEAEPSLSGFPVTLLPLLEVMRTDLHSSQHALQTSGHKRADRANPPVCLSACLLLLPHHFEVLRSGGQLCAHGACALTCTSTLTCTRTSCLILLFWENLFSRCKTPPDLAPNICYHFFQTCNTSDVFCKQSQRRATPDALSRSSRCRTAATAQHQCACCIKVCWGNDVGFGAEMGPR